MWEYKVEDFENYGIEPLEYLLSKLGEEGWELIQYDAYWGGKAIFKRRKT